MWEIYSKTVAEKEKRNAMKSNTQKKEKQLSLIWPLSRSSPSPLPLPLSFLSSPSSSPPSSHSLSLLFFLLHRTTLTYFKTNHRWNHLKKWDIYSEEQTKTERRPQQKKMIDRHEVTGKETKCDDNTRIDYIFLVFFKFESMGKIPFQAKLLRCHFFLIFSFFYIWNIFIYFVFFFSHIFVRVSSV